MPVPVSVSDPLPVQPLTVNVLPLLVAARLAVVMPLKVKLAPPVTTREVLASATLLKRVSARISEVPLSVPLPVQPVTVKVLPPAPLSVRFAVVIPLRPGDMPSVDVNEALVRVYRALLVAVTVPVPAGAESDPVPVQALTVKELLLALAPVRDATVMPLRLSVNA